MFTKLKKSKGESEKGFTIIEVMIVLAIAGLILLIVFLAIPALQRNARNTQRKNDAANASSLINEYATNQNGTLPAVACLNGTADQITIAGGTCASPTNSVTGGMGGQFTAVAMSNLPGGGAAAASTTTLRVYKQATCQGNTVIAGTARQAAVWYAVEPNVAQCVAP